MKLLQVQILPRWLLLVLAASNAPSTRADDFARVCTIASAQPVRAVFKDESSGLFQFVSHEVDDRFNSSHKDENISSSNHSKHNNKRLRQRQRYLTESSVSLPTSRNLDDSTASNQTRPQNSAFNNQTQLEAQIDDDVGEEEEGGAFDYSVFAQGRDNPDEQAFYVRECPCVPGIYCTLEFDTCGIPSIAGTPFECFQKSSRKTLLRNAWPLLLLWYTTLIFFFFFTEKGHHARHFIYLRGCGCLCLVRNCWCAQHQRRNNQRMVDRFLYAHGFLTTSPDTLQQNNVNNANVPANATVTESLPVARPIDPHAPLRLPTELVLKTKTYGVDFRVRIPNGEGDDNALNLDQDEDEDEHTCTICFTPLEIGDRVGALPCRHSFHVECLKSWLPRRNVCPLCQNTEVATPQYHGEPMEPQEEQQQQAQDAADDNDVPTARPTPVMFAAVSDAAPPESAPENGNV